MRDRSGFLLLGNILRPDKPSLPSVTGIVPKFKMVLGELPEASVRTLAPALVLSVNLKLWVL